jgi:hypothetical protein
VRIDTSLMTIADVVDRLVAHVEQITGKGIPPA